MSDISLDVVIEPRETTVVRDPALDVFCDFVDGWAFGSALGIGIHAMEGWWDVLDVAGSVSAATMPVGHKPEQICCLTDLLVDVIFPSAQTTPSAFSNACHTHKVATN